MVWERRCRQWAMAVRNLPVAAAVVAAAVAEEEVAEAGPQQSAPPWPEQRSLRKSAPWVASRSVQNYQDGEVPVDPQRLLDVPSPSILCALSSPLLPRVASLYRRDALPSRAFRVPSSLSASKATRVPQIPIALILVHS